MSNHYHSVLHVDLQRSRQWSDEEVISRWQILYEGTDLVRRDRLSSVSWFMAYLHEFIARKDNAEDKYKGRFWEGRFKFKAMLDVIAILLTMAYVCLDPVKAGIDHNL